MQKDEVGVLIDRGARDWQIFQQDSSGTADIALAGRWLTRTPFKKTADVIVRVVLEDEYRAVSRTLDWQATRTHRKGTWSIVLRRVPRGGLYRVETGLRLDNGPVEWAERGDAVHHIGVGDLWVIAGQSNAAGYGRSPAYDPPELGLHMFRASGEWALASHPLSDSTRTRYPANREGANGSHSPFLAFARTLKRRLGYPIGLVPASLGGSAISAWLNSMDGVLFRNMLAYIRDAGGRVRGVCWSQGCTDTLTPQKDTYLDCFTQFVRELRRAVKQKDLPIITAQINRVVNHPEGAPTNAAWDLVREAQRQAARTLPGVSVISTLDCGLADCIHNNTASNLVIGERMAAVALGRVYGQDIECLHPDVKKCRQAGPRVVEIEFENVVERLAFEVIAPAGFPFAVRDRSGLVPVERITLPRRDVIRLELTRTLEKPATITGAPGTNPPFVVPYDIGGFRPMLAFTVRVR